MCMYLLELVVCLLNILCIHNNCMIVVVVKLNFSMISCQFIIYKMERLMKKFLLSIFTVVLVVANCGQAIAGPKVFRVSAGLPETNNEVIGLRLMEKYVEEKTEGRYDVQIFPNNQLGDDKEAIEQMQQGIIQMCPSGTSALSNFDKSFNLLSSPYLLKNADDIERLLNGKFGNELLATLKKSNLIGFGFGIIGFTNISNSVHPIVTAADIEGIKLRCVQNAFLLDFFKEVGANPVPMSFSELFSAMQQGVVDGQFNPLTTILSNNFQEVQPYISLTKDIASLVCFVVSKSYFDNMSVEDQKIFEEGIALARNYMNDNWSVGEKDAYDKLIATGKVKINDVDDSVKADLFKKGFSVIEEYGNKSDPVLFKLLKSEMGM